MNSTVKGAAVAPVTEEWTLRWAEYRRWAEAQSELDPRSPADIMADIDVLYQGYPPEVRSTDPDPMKLGIQDLRRVLALYERKLQSRSGARRGH